MKLIISLSVLFILTNAEGQQPSAKIEALTGKQKSNIPVVKGAHGASVLLPRVSSSQETQSRNVQTAQADSSISVNCSGTFYTSCYDCRNIVICAGEAEPLYAGACPASAPYCDNFNSETRCAVNMFDSWNEQHCDANVYRCTSRGYFPDIFDARVYHYCSWYDDSQPQRYECPEDTIFDMTTHNCKRAIPFDCTGKDNQFVHHHHNGAYYAFCRVNGLSREIIPYRCRDDQNFVFNLATNTCEYQCKGEGVFVDRDSCYNYYECSKNGNGLSHRKLRCPQMYVFSKTQGACVPDMNPCYPELGYM
ncbi:hypothetical protein DMENIID0001_044000 [Sergentomyia squamirostris]